MAGKLELLLEAEKRGILPEDKKVLLTEARKRGLVPSAVEEPSNPIIQAGKDAIGGVEAAGRMLWNVPVGTMAQGIRTLGALGTGSDLPEAIQLGRESAEAASIKPFTKSGEVADEALGHGYEALRNMAGQANAATSENYDPNKPSSKDSLMLGNEAANQTLGELGFDLAAFGGLMRGMAKGPRERATRAEMERLAAEQKAAMEQAAADRAFVEARRQKVAADQGEARGLQGEVIQQRINEMNMREATPEFARAPESTPSIPEKTTLEAPQPTETNPMSRELGGRDLPPALETETPHGGLAEPNVQPSLDFQGRAEHPLNLYEILHETQGDPKTTLNYAVNRVRDLWRETEAMLQEASDARLAKTNLGTVKRGPSGPTREMLEQRKAEIGKMADELATAYGEYLTEGDRVSMNAIKKIHEMSTSPKIGGLDMAGRSDVIERTQSGRDMGIGKPSVVPDSGGLGIIGGEGGYRGLLGEIMRPLSAGWELAKGIPMISFSKAMGETSSLSRTFRNAFMQLKREYPRFSELRDIKVMTGKEWERRIDGLIRTGKIDKSKRDEFLNATAMQGGNNIEVNAHHPVFADKDPVNAAMTFAHELTHEWQDRRGQTEKFEADPNYNKQLAGDWDKRPWEQGAMKAENTATARLILNPREHKPILDKKPTQYKAFGSKPNAGPSFEQFKAQMEKDGVEFLSDKHARAMYELRNEPKHTPGSPTESIGEVTSKIKGLQDLTDQYLNTWTPAEMTKAVVDWGKDIGIVSKNLVDKVINGRFVAKTHPLLKYVSSNIHRIKNDTRLKSENVLMGDAYDAKGNRIPAKDSPMYIWSRLSDKSREVINDVGQHFTNKNDSVVTDAELNAASRELHGRDMTPDEIQSYRDRRRGMDRTWKELNEYILNHPKPNGDLREPLPYLHNFWSPAEFGGKFLIFVKDKVSGEVEAMNGSYFKPDLKKLQAEFPEHTVSFIEKDIANTLNPAALEATIRYMAEPKRNAVRKALNEAMRSQGFRKHGKERKGISGWLGSEGGKKGVDNYEKVYEEYVRSAFNHIGNRELDKLHSEVADNSKVREVAPRAQLLSLESIDQARGRGNAFFSALESETGKLLNEVRLPQSFFGDIGRVSNEIMVKNLIAFGKVSQIVAQGFQAIASAPVKGLMINAEHAGMGAGSSLATMMKVGAKTMKDLVNPSEQTLKDIIGLRREGALEANFQYDYKEYNKGEQYSIRQTIKNNPKEWVALTPILTKIEVEAVRKPAGLMFVNLLRELKYPENNIYKLAAELTDQYEATTKQYESAHIFGRTGTTGRMLRPLQSFTTTWVGTYLEALGSAVRNPTSAAHALPLLYGLGGMYLVTGLLGMPGVKEWDLVASTINKLANTTFPTGTETILRYAKSPEQRFGWLWSKLGINLGTTMAAPTMTQSVAPGVQFIGNVISALSVGARETGVFGEHNKPTQAEKREAVKGITPAATWGFTEGYYSNPETMGTAERIVKNPEAGPYVNKNNIGSVQRGDAEWNARKWLGSYTLKEAEQKARNWEGKRTKMEEQSHRSDLAELMVDQYITTGKINPKLMERAIELQYPAKDLKDAIKRDLMKRYLAEDQQLIGKGRSLKQQRAAKLLQELQ